MSKAKSTKSKAKKTLFVRVRDNADSDQVKYGTTIITKKQYVEVDEGVKDHRGFAILELQSNQS